MSAERVAAELTLLRGWWPDLRVDASGSWVLLEPYALPAGWAPGTCAVAFQIPPVVGQQPYGFWTRGPVLFNGAVPSNYTFPVAAGTVPFTGEWGQFSWAPQTWQPGPSPADGDNVLGFARSIAHRFAEGA